MYPGVLILEFTHSEVLAPSRRSGRFMPALWVLAAIAPEDGVYALQGAPTGAVLQ